MDPSQDPLEVEQDSMEIKQELAELEQDAMEVVQEEDKPKLNPVKWNYKPQILLADGSLLIEPQFGDIDEKKKGLSSSEIEEITRKKKLATLKNAEIPKLLYEPGELTKEEDKLIQYHRLVHNQRVYVGWPDGEKIFSSMFLDETFFEADLQLRGWVDELRDRLLRRGKGTHRLHGREPSAFEKHVRKTLTDDSNRSYYIGFNEEQGHPGIGPNFVHGKVVRNPERVAEVSRLLSNICVRLITHAVPEEERKLVDEQADIAVPLTFGTFENNYCCAYILNYADKDEISLSATVGAGGGLHVDSKDDPRLWCIFLPLSYLPEKTWPGRSIIPSLRIYAPLAPYTAIIGKAVHPHLSLGAQAMKDSKRQEYKPAAEGMCPLNPDDHVFCRLGTVSFMKRAVFDKSPIRPRGAKNGDIAGYPDLLPPAMFAFGNNENLFDYKARAEAVNRILLPTTGSCLVTPTAAKIADWYSYKVGGEIRTPSEQRIQKVFDSYDPENEAAKAHKVKWEKYTELAEKVLSMKQFSGSTKEAEPAIVGIDELGSSFARIDLDKSDWDQRIRVEKKTKKRKEKVVPEDADSEHGEDVEHENGNNGKRKKRKNLE